MRYASLSQALASPDTYTFIPGAGYADLRSAPPANPGGPKGKCFPPPNTADLSWHTLTSGHGEPVNFQWLERNRVWLRIEVGARRIAFDPEYLSSNGWVYSGAAQGRHE